LSQNVGGGGGGVVGCMFVWLRLLCFSF